MVGLFLALLENYKQKTCLNNEIHCILQSRQHLYQSTQQQLREFFQLWKIPHTISRFPDVKCVVTIAHNVRWTPNRIQIAPVELFSALKVNQSGHFMLTSLFWMSQLWFFSKSTDWSLCDFVVIINVQNKKAEITPKNEKAYSGHRTHFLLVTWQTLTDIHFVCCWLKGVLVFWRWVVIFSRF